MPFLSLSLGYKYRGAFAKLPRYCGESSLCAALGRARIDNLSDAVEQQGDKTGFGPSVKQIIANNEHAIMIF